MNELEKIALYINQSNTSWKANPHPNNLYNDKRMFNLILDPKPENFDEPPFYSINEEDLPTTFDARE